MAIIGHKRGQSIEVLIVAGGQKGDSGIVFFVGLDLLTFLYGRKHIYRHIFVLYEIDSHNHKQYHDYNRETNGAGNDITFKGTALFHCISSC